MSIDEEADLRRVRTTPVPRADCPLAAAAELLGQPWVLLLVRELFYGVDRFDDLRTDLGMSSSTLSHRLATLTEAGIVDRRAYRDPGRRLRHRYVLTEAGRDLTTAIWALTQWSERHLLGRRAPARLVAASSGDALDAALVGDDGLPVTLDQTTWRIEGPPTTG